MIPDLLSLICVGYIIRCWYLLRNLWFIMLLFRVGFGKMLLNDIDDSTWFTILPSTLLADFARDRNGLPNYRFPQLFMFLLFMSFFFILRVLAQSPLFCKYFPPFFNNITYWKSGRGWRFLWGANLVEMLQILPDAQPFSWPYQKKGKLQFQNEIYPMMTED